MSTPPTPKLVCMGGFSEWEENFSQVLRLEIVSVRVLKRSLFDGALVRLIRKGIVVER